MDLQSDNLTEFSLESFTESSISNDDLLQFTQKDFEKEEGRYSSDFIDVYKENVMSDFKW